MYTYPWDLLDHGIQPSLDDLERAGVDGIQLAFSYHVASFLTPRNPKRRVHHGPPGALHFLPESIPEVAWPFRPPIAPTVDGTAYLTTLLDAIASRGMATVAWVVFLYNHALAQARPELAHRNAFGDVHGAQLCPSNPDVRAYAKALTESVVRHPGVTGIVCESLSFLPYDYGLLNLKASVEPSPRLRHLLALCFCDACNARARDAGLDAPRLAQDVAKTIDSALAALPDAYDAQPVDRHWIDTTFDGRLGALHAVRTQAATSLHEQVLTLARDAGLRTGSTANETGPGWDGCIDERTLQPRRDELRLELFPDTEPARLAHILHDARARAGRDAAGVPNPVYGLAQLRHFPSEHSFATTFENAYAAGLRHVRLYQFGLLTQRQWRWIEHLPFPNDTMIHPESPTEQSERTKR